MEYIKTPLPKLHSNTWPPFLLSKINIVIFRQHQTVL